MKRILLAAAIALALVWLGGCTVSPLAPLPASNPASPAAVEGRAAPARFSLASDTATRQSWDLLNSQDQAGAGDMSGMNMGGDAHAGH